MVLITPAEALKFVALKAASPKVDPSAAALFIVIVDPLPDVFDIVRIPVRPSSVVLELFVDQAGRPPLTVNACPLVPIASLERVPEELAYNRSPAE